MVMAAPLVEALAQAGHRVEVLAPAATRPVVSRMPGVAAGHLARFPHGGLQLVERWRIARGLARLRFDAAIVLPNTLKSALAPWLAGIPVRIGYVGEGRYGLLNRTLRAATAGTELQTERYLQLAQALLGYVPASHRPSLRVTAPQRQQALRALGLEVGVPVLGLCPGAEFGPAKRWPPAHFAAVADAWHRHGGRTWLFGGPADRVAAAAILAELSPAAGESVVDLCGRTSLGQAIDLLSACTQVVCNDSGLMHVAAALDVPLVAVFGSTSIARTPPASARATALSLALDCAPCFERTCPLGHTRCLTALEPQRVLDALNWPLRPVGGD